MLTFYFFNIDLLEIVTENQVIILKLNLWNNLIMKLENKMER